MALKYPIELELSSYCGLRCKSCINSDLVKRKFIEAWDYRAIIDFLFLHKDCISFIDISGIWDAFLHPKISDFLEYFYNTFKWCNISVNFSQKWQAITEEHICILEKMQESWIQIDIFIWVFSIRENVYKYLSWWDSFKRVVAFAKLMHRKGFNVSMELLNNYFSHWEYEKFYELCNAIGCSASIKNITNFWWLLSTQQWYLFGYNNMFESPNLIRASEKIVDARHIEEKCGSTPYISAEWKIIVCSYLQGYEDDRGLIWHVDDLSEMTLQEIYEKSYEKMFTKICEGCSLYKSEKNWYSEDYYISESWDIVRDKFLVKIYPYQTAEDLLFLYHNEPEFITSLIADESNINKHEKIDFLYILCLSTKIYDMNFTDFFQELLISWWLQESYNAFQSMNIKKNQVNDIEFIRNFCNKLDIEAIEYYLYCYMCTYITREVFITRIALLMQEAKKQLNATNLAYLVILKDKILEKELGEEYGEELVKRYYWIFS